MSDFETFELGDLVTIKANQARGELRGICFDLHGDAKFLVRYVNSIGSVMDDWFTSGEITHAFVDKKEPDGRGTAASHEPPTVQLSEMVDRFLAWPLPSTVCADVCATRPNTEHRTGTNLLNAEQARLMLLHVLNSKTSPM